MKILIYCQHVLGIGHLFRTLEIAKSMKEHQVTLVLGGPPASISLPEHVQIVQLPGLKMDADFSALATVAPNRKLEEVKAERTTALTGLARELQPDAALIELFPFGRNGFSFELIPLLKTLRSNTESICKIVCSLRDILVEKKNQDKFEHRVINRLNDMFDGLLIHGDTNVISLNETFSRMDEINIPVRYTGYICEKSHDSRGYKTRELIRLGPDEKLIVVSAGGGNVGYDLLYNSIRAFDRLEFPVCMQIFTGPYLDDKDFSTLKEKTVPGVRVERFTDDFPAWLCAADLSISMGGYNTTLNTVAAGTPALILPFSQNREQRLRAERLVPMANIGILDEDTLSPGSLADSITSMIDRKKQVPDILLEGATTTNRILTQWVRTGELA